MGWDRGPDVADQWALGAPGSPFERSLALLVARRAVAIDILLALVGSTVSVTFASGWLVHNHHGDRLRRALARAFQPLVCPRLNGRSLSKFVSPTFYRLSILANRHAHAHTRHTRAASPRPLSPRLVSAVISPPPSVAPAPSSRPPCPASAEMQREPGHDTTRQNRTGQTGAGSDRPGLDSVAPHARNVHATFCTRASPPTRIPSHFLVCHEPKEP